MAEDLEAHGLEAGDIVVIFLPNWAELQIVFLATLRLGAIPASLPIRTDRANLAYVAELSGARLLIAAERHRGNATGDLARSAAADCAHAPGVLVIDDDGATRWCTTPARSRCKTPQDPELDHLMFTSSTTGRPKAVMHSANTLAALNFTFTERFGLGPDQSIFMPSPLGHSVGAIHGTRLSLYNGAPLVLLDRWEPNATLEAVAEHGCAFTAAATPFLKDLVDAAWEAPQPKLAPLRWFLCGGAQVPPALMEQARAQFPNTIVTVLWGMTEGGLTTCVADSTREQFLETAGVGLPGLELRVLDGEGNALPTGEEGELAMRGPGVFTGYCGQCELYESLLTDDGFFRTGDLAQVDEHEYVRITGRLKDLIIRGGVNIAPVPIEDALAAHPEVQAVAVVGYPDERMGERICAVVITKTKPGPRPEELHDFVRERGLPKVLWPELVRFVDEFPRTPAGKIRKVQLRDAVVAADANAAGASERKT